MIKLILLIQKKGSKTRTSHTIIFKLKWVLSFLANVVINNARSAFLKFCRITYLCWQTNHPISPSVILSRLLSPESYLENYDCNNIVSISKWIYNDVQFMILSATLGLLYPEWTSRLKNKNIYLNTRSIQHEMLTSCVACVPIIIWHTGIHLTGHIFEAGNLYTFNISLSIVSFMWYILLGFCLSVYYLEMSSFCFCLTIFICPFGIVSSISI